MKKRAGRPKLPVAEQRSTVSVRVAPSTKSWLDRHPGCKGRVIDKLVEQEQKK